MTVEKTKPIKTKAAPPTNQNSSKQRDEPITINRQQLPVTRSKGAKTHTYMANLVPRVSLLCLSRWNRDPGCGWSRDHLSIQNRRVGGYSSTFFREDDKIPHSSSRFFYHPDSGWSSDQLQPGSLFQRLREAKRDPGNEVATWRDWFWFPFSLVEKSIFSQSLKRSNCNHVITFDSHLKTALSN